MIPDLPAVWLPQWEAVLWRSEMPLEKRLSGFYREFVRWLDSVFSCAETGVGSAADNRQWRQMTEAHLINPLAMEMRLLCGRYRRDVSPGPEEQLMVWGLHGQIIFSAWLAHQKDALSDQSAGMLADTLTNTFCRGASAMFSSVSDRIFPL